MPFFQYSPTLPKKEESELAQFVAEVSEIFYRRSRKQIKGMVEKVASEKGLLNKKQISDGWFRRFLEQQPQLQLRKGDHAAMVCLDAVKDKQALENYFSLLNVRHGHQCTRISGVGDHVTGSLRETQESGSSN